MTASSVLTGVLLKGTFAARPAANAVAGGTLYSATDTNVIYQSDGASWSTYATVGSGAPTDATYITQTANGSLSAEQALSSLSTGLLKVTTGTGVLSTASASDLPSHDHAGTSDGGKLTNDAHDGYSIYEEIAAPSAPAADTARLYAKDNGSGTTELYYKNSGGTERDLSAAGSGLSDQGTATYLDFAEAAAPATPAANKVRIYAKADGSLYQKDDAGLETGLAGGGGTPSHAYYTRLCALLEPDALEAAQLDSFSYAIGGSVTKHLIASYNTRIGASGRMEIRNPIFPLALRGVTLNGIGSGACAILLDPTLPTYAAAWTTYHDRLETLATSTPKVINLTSASQKTPALFGAYGAIVLRAVNFGFAWVIFTIQTKGWNLGDEVGDATTQRIDTPLLLPVNKFTANEAWSDDTAEGSAAASIVYVLLASTWSEVTDPNTYDLRDDFMGASLNTGATWTRAQSTVGNVEINTTYQWLKMVGNTVWGDNGLFSQGSISRAAGKIYLVDVYIPSGSGTPNLIVGWHDGAGQSYSDFAHGVDFTESGGTKLNVFENGNARGAVGSGWTAGCTYRVRITLGASSAAYAIQGGTEYAALGGSSWTDITPGTTSSTTTPVHMGASIESAVTVYLSDMRVY